ncbi:MAG: atpF [Candidatus Saccharibacteria bacterium]|nr:atpF [Candidatus Saccharibacteria bacterium]
MSVLTQFAETKAASGNSDIFTTLGINWQLLIIQIVAFAILVWALGKYVYPFLMKSVDERQAKIEESVKATQEAENNAQSAQDEIAKMLKEARTEAKDIVATAKDEAAAMVAASDEKAKSRAEKIVADAQEQLSKDVIAARKQLHNDTIELVALATEKVVGKVVDGKADDSIIKNVVKELQ